MRRPAHGPTTTLLAVIAVLLVLTVLSLGASYLALPVGLEVLVALGIASVKATLVMLVFMELREHRGGVRFVAVTGPAFILTLITLMLADVWTR